jgi:hypothetical protein
MISLNVNSGEKVELYFYLNWTWSRIFVQDSMKGSIMRMVTPEAKNGSYHKKCYLYSIKTATILTMILGGNDIP